MSRRKEGFHALSQFSPNRTYRKHFSSWVVSSAFALAG